MPTTSRTVLVLRTTYRLHDNQALQHALRDPNLAAVVLPIDVARVQQPRAAVPLLNTDRITDPHFTQWKHPHVWGYHQYVFLLHAIRTFVAALRKRCNVPVHVWLDTVPKMVSALTAGYDTCITDVCDDHAWWAMDAQLATAFPVGKLVDINTHTLLDWRAEAHRTFLHEWAPTRRGNNGNQRFKDYVASHAHTFTAHLDTATTRPHAKRSGAGLTASANARRRSTRKARTPTSGTTPRTLSDTALRTQIRKWTALMRERNITPFEPPAKTSCEQWALRLLQRTEDAMCGTQWHKPDTAPVLTVREFSTDLNRCTSKLSPFLALGVISPRLVYRQWMGATSRGVTDNATRPSSAVSQLLWREEFHAVTRLDGFWDNRHTSKPTQPRFWARDGAKGTGWRITKGDDTRLQPFLHATTGEPDLDETLRVLVRDGWIHHLRRHLVADYLTRGKLFADWMLGESWFRHTLVDHDACINRCNWMWLSASEFSVAQLTRHYGYKDYVQRKSKGVVVVTDA